MAGYKETRSEDDRYMYLVLTALLALNVSKYSGSFCCGK